MSDKKSPLEVFTTFLKLGCTSFGGPVAHLGYFHKELVEKRGWVSESQYTQLLAICQFLPGPASSQLGFSLGLIRGGWLGALAAFLAFTLPSAIVLIVFASALPLLDNALGQAAIKGLKIVALAIVADAVLGMARKLCPDIPRATIAALAASALLVVASASAQILVVAMGAIAGMFFCKASPENSAESLPIRYRLGLGYLFLGIFFILLFMLPVLSSSTANPVSVINRFYQAGALVFGGGHVVLPLLQESMVSTGWLSETEFLAGYGASQAIPGPMFAFSAYLGTLITTDVNPLITAVIALLSIFLPGFLLLLGVLPIWKAIAENLWARNAINGINAAVVGLLAAALYDPIFTSAVNQPVDLAIAVIGFVLLRVWQLSALWVVIWCVLASMSLALT